jgi:hypothetical protein
MLRETDIDMNGQSQPVGDGGQGPELRLTGVSEFGSF